MRSLLFIGLALMTVAGAGSAANDQLLHRDGGNAPPEMLELLGEIRSLDGSSNNLANPEWGQAYTPYLRTAPANYADGISSMADGPEPRLISNRIFNDVSQNLFSENGVTQWAFVWGQFLDHTFGLRETEGGDDSPIGFDASDPLEDFVNDMGDIDFSRSAAAPGTGENSPLQQLNTVSSYIDAWAVYGGTEERLEWLREGPVDGDLSNNSAYLLLAEDGYLPHSAARGDAAPPPDMQLMGRLAGSPDGAVVAGDVRANENIALTAVHTLFAREHNRIVSSLPNELPEESKFQIARAVVIAEQQYITYNEFLTAIGVELDSSSGYDPEVNAGLSNEFAAAAFRAHSMIHGEFEIEADSGAYTVEQLESLEKQGVEMAAEDEALAFAVPLNVAFGSPDLVPELGLGQILRGLGGEAQYKNDEQIDNQLRSVLFQVPGPASRIQASVSTASVCPIASASCLTSERSTSSVAATTASPHTTTSARRMGWTVRSRLGRLLASPRRSFRTTRPSMPITRSTIGTSSTSHSSSMPKATFLTRGVTRRPRARSRARGGPRSRQDLVRFTATPTKLMRSSEWLPRNTWKEPSSASCSLRFGNGNSRRCATVTASSMRHTRL